MLFTAIAIANVQTHMLITTIEVTSTQTHAIYN